jgi:hypothetical protein
LDLLVQQIVFGGSQQQDSAPVLSLDHGVGGIIEDTNTNGFAAMSTPKTTGKPHRKMVNLQKKIFY